MKDLLSKIVIHLLFLAAIITFVWMILGFVLTLGGAK